MSNPGVAFVWIPIFPSICRACGESFPSPAPDEPHHTWCPECEDKSAARHAVGRETGLWITACPDPDCASTDTLHRLQRADIRTSFGMTSVNGVVTETPLCEGHKPEPFAEVLGCGDCYWQGSEYAVGWRREA